VKVFPCILKCGHTFCAICIHKHFDFSCSNSSMPPYKCCYCRSEILSQPVFDFNLDSYIRIKVCDVDALNPAKRHWENRRNVYILMDWKKKRIMQERWKAIAAKYELNKFEYKPNGYMHLSNENIFELKRALAIIILVIGLVYFQSR
jgi:hypothetical protein